MPSDASFRVCTTRSDRSFVAGRGDAADSQFFLVVGEAVTERDFLVRALHHFFFGGRVQGRSWRSEAGHYELLAGFGRVTQVLSLL